MNNLSKGRMIKAICEYLGVELEEEFEVKFKFEDSGLEYKMTKEGLMIRYGSGEWITSEILQPLLFGKYKVVKKLKFDNLEKEILKKAFKQGYTTIVRDVTDVYLNNSEIVTPFLLFEQLKDNVDYKIEDLIKGFENE